MRALKNYCSDSFRNLYLASTENITIKTPIIEWITMGTGFCIWEPMQNINAIASAIAIVLRVSFFIVVLF